MGFSVSPIQPMYSNFSVPAAGFTGTSLQVGTAVKDLPTDGATQMKKEYEHAVKSAHEQYKNDTEQYKVDFELATTKAQEAAKVISEERKKKMIAVTLLVTTIIASVGILIASAVTMTWPIAVAAVPFLIALVPTSYYTHIFRTSVSQLEHRIRAPKALPKPALGLPAPYNPKLDMDLPGTRTELQNSLALKTLAGLVETGHSTDDMVRYALLDRAPRQLADDKRPAFYGKCIQLIQAYGRVCEERSHFEAQAGTEHHRLRHELCHWKSQQDGHISVAEANLHEQERKEHQRKIVEAQNPKSNQGVCKTVLEGARIITHEIAKIDLDNQKKEIERTYGRREAEITNWYSNTTEAISTQFAAAMSQLEQQYMDAKVQAA
jgi:hypothetical protein